MAYKHFKAIAVLQYEPEERKIHISMRVKIETVVEQKLQVIRMQL